MFETETEKTETGYSSLKTEPNRAEYEKSKPTQPYLKVLTVPQLMQVADSKFQLSITLFENAYFLTFSLNLFLNSFWSCYYTCCGRGH